MVLQALQYVNGYIKIAGNPALKTIASSFQVPVPCHWHSSLYACMPMMCINTDRMPPRLPRGTYLTGLCPA